MAIAMAQIDAATQDFHNWLDQCQHEDCPWLYEDTPASPPRQPVRGRNGKPTGQYQPSSKESEALLAALHGETEMQRAKGPRQMELPDKGDDQDLLRQQRASASAMLAPLDATATAMEHKWGVGRLQTLVPTEWAEKFHSAFTKLNAAIEKLDLTDLRERAEIMRRGWVKLDELATAAGHPPWASPDVWEVQSPAGRIYAIARGPMDERNYPAASGVRILTLDEVARVLDAWDSDGFITEMRAQFPGAQIVSAGRPAIAPEDTPDAGN